jgi:hypothetical protein
VISEVTKIRVAAWSAREKRAIWRHIRRMYGNGPRAQQVALAARYAFFKRTNNDPKERTKYRRLLRVGRL